MNENYNEAPIVENGEFLNIQTDVNGNFGYIKDKFDEIDTSITTINSDIGTINSTIETNNANVNAKIDMGIIFGAYMGSGTPNRTIEVKVNGVSVNPIAVEVYTSAGQQVPSYYNYYGGLAFENSPCTLGNNKNIIEVTEGGFIVYYYDSSNNHVYSNISGTTYYYKAYINGTIADPQPQS